MRTVIKPFLIGMSIGLAIFLSLYGAYKIGDILAQMLQQNSSVTMKVSGQLARQDPPAVQPTAAPARRRTGGCGGGCAGNCGAGRDTVKVDVETSGNELVDAEKAGYKYYVERYGDADITVKATNYGCHIQADVYKNGQVIESLGYYNGGIYEID